MYDDALGHFDGLLARAQKATDAREQAEMLGHFHTLIRSLGREALSENADWLTLNRARPFETPVR